MYYQIFLSPQVKGWAIITYKHGIYELPNNLRLRKLRNIKKVSKLHRMIALCPPSPLPPPPPPPSAKIKILFALAKNSQKIAIKLFLW